MSKLKRRWIIINSLITPFSYWVVCECDKHLNVIKYRIERIKDFKPD